MTKSSRSTSIMSVLVVDVQPLMQFAIRTTLVSMGRITIVAAVHSLDEAATAIVTHKPDVILYNLVESASQMQKAIRTMTTAAEKARIPARICMFGSYPSPSLVAAALKIGVMAYLSTTHDGTSLYEMLVAVAEGQTYENDEMQIARASTPSPDAEAKLSELTHREREILICLADGATNQQIAELLDIRLSTVKKHNGNIYVKLGARHRSDALAFLMRNNLLPVLLNGSA